MNVYQKRALLLFPLFALVIFTVARSGRSSWIAVPIVAIFVWPLWRS